MQAPGQPLVQAVRSGDKSKVRLTLGSVHTLPPAAACACLLWFPKALDGEGPVQTGRLTAKV